MNIYADRKRKLTRDALFQMPDAPTMNSEFVAKLIELNEDAVKLFT